MTSVPRGGESETTNRLSSLGKTFLGVGVILLLLRGVATSVRGLPAFWYDNQPLWIVLAAGMITVGWIVLWGPATTTSTSWRPSFSGTRFRHAELYVGQGCHLCDDAIALLRTYQVWLPPIEVIDIQSDAALIERFGTCVPVVVLDGKIRFRGRISETLLQRLIEGTPPVKSSES